MRNRSRWTVAVAAAAVTGPLMGAAATPANADIAPSCPTATGQRIVETPATFPKTVALTFDDGPNPTWTPQVLAVLAEHHVHATFFVIGKKAATHPEVLQQVVDAGHAIGNHTWHHPTRGNGMYALTDAELVTEFDPTTALIKDVTGRPVCFFRAPQGKDDRPVIRKLAQERGQTVTGYHTASDYLQPDKIDSVWVTRIEQRLQHRGPHPILLLHDGGAFRGNSIKALDTIITWYLDHGYVFTDPAGRPFPGDLPAETKAPATGWAIPPDWTPPDNGLTSLSPQPTNLPDPSPTDESTSEHETTDSVADGEPPDSSAPTTGDNGETGSGQTSRLAQLARNSDQDPLAARQVTNALIRYLMVFSAPPT